MSGFDNEVLYAVGERLQPSDAQAIGIMQQTPNTTNVSRINHVGDPNGVVAANPSSICHDPVSGFFWLKVSGTGTTVWQRIFAAPSSGVLTLTGDLGPAISPNGAGNINTLTNATTARITGSGNSLTMDFSGGALSNLGLGSSFPAITLGGQADTGCGVLALSSIISGRHNTGIGAGALQNLTTSDYNTLVGSQAGLILVSGSANCGCGYESLASLVSGSFNTSIGYQTLLNCTGSNNTVLGSLSGGNYTGTESSNVLINNGGTIGESNVMRLGTAGAQNSCFVSGITGVTVAASAPVGVASTGQLSSLGFGTAGQVLTSTGAASSPQWQNGASILTITSVNNAASPYTVLSTDQFIACQTSTGAITIRLPNAPTTGRVIYIKDSNGAAAASNISITTVGGTVTIDGSTTYTISSNYGSISVIFDGSNYEVF